MTIPEKVHSDNKTPYPALPHSLSTAVADICF